MPAIIKWVIDPRQRIIAINPHEVVDVHGCDRQSMDEGGCRDMQVLTASYSLSFRLTIACTFCICSA